MAEAINIINLMRSPRLLGAHFAGPSWDTWAAVFCAAHGLPMTKEAERLFRSVAGDRKPPPGPVRELHCSVGRRGGKDSMGSLKTTHSAITDFREYLRPGEVNSVICAAVDKSQAAIMRRMTLGNFEKTEALKPLITRTTLGGFELGALNAEVEIVTSDFRAIRGRAISCMVCDEIAFWQQNSDSGSNSDVEVINAALPALATLPGSMLLGISTPWGRRGVLYERWRKYFGQDDPDVLVVQGGTRQFNPTIDQRLIDDAMDRDPISAAAEWGGQFRSDIYSYISAEVLDACITPGCYERGYEGRLRYQGFVDMSGGSIDSSALCIAHRGDDGRAVIDCVREVRAPHSPVEAVRQFCETLATYRIHEVTGDRYAAEWSAEQFRAAGVTYNASERNKSQLYSEMTPLLMSRKVDLLDHDRARSQFLGLERRTGSSGRDVIDHGPGGKDDICNAVSGAAVLVAGQRDWLTTWQLLAGLHPHQNELDRTTISPTRGLH
jgi:hypothetical protein